MKDEGYVLNLDDYSDIGTHWIALYALSNNIKTNIFRIQAYDSIMCSQFCIGFFDYMLTGKKKVNRFTNLFSSNTLQFQIKGEGGVNREAGKCQSK